MRLKKNYRVSSEVSTSLEFKLTVRSCNQIGNFLYHVTSWRGIFEKSSLPEKKISIKAIEALQSEMGQELRSDCYDN